MNRLSQQIAEAEDSVKLPKGRVVALEPIRHSFVHRALWRCNRSVRAWMWRHRLAEFGDGSRIDHPAFVIGGESIRIGTRVLVHRGSRIEALNPADGVRRITIGDGVTIHPGSHIGAVDSITIANGVLFASGVYVTDHDHDFSNPEEPVIDNQRVLTAPVHIGEFAWLGERVMVLKGVTIGERSIIGAGSVVTADVLPYSIAVGIPARVIRIYDRQAKRWARVDH